jgi:hypothetical protein
MIGSESDRANDTRGCAEQLHQITLTIQLMRSLSVIKEHNMVKAQIRRDLLKQQLSIPVLNEQTREEFYIQDGGWFFTDQPDDLDYQEYNLRLYDANTKAYVATGQVSTLNLWASRLYG